MIRTAALVAIAALTLLAGCGQPPPSMDDAIMRCAYKSAAVYLESNPSDEHSLDELIDVAADVCTTESTEDPAGFLETWSP